MLMGSVIMDSFNTFQNHVDEAMEMYQEMHMWDEAIEVAAAKVNLQKNVYLEYFIMISEWPLVLEPN